MKPLWRQLATALNWPVFLAVGALAITGVFSIAAHAASGARAAGDARKQALFVVLGVACMLAVQLASYVSIGRYAWGYYLLSMALLVYTVMPWAPQSGLLSVPEINGARAWINCGVLNLQPSELTKVAVCMLLARYLRFRSSYRALRGLLPPMALVLAPLVLILRQPDLGTALVFIPAVFLVLYAAGARGRHLLAVLAVGVVLGAVAWFAGPRQKTGLSYEVPVLRHLPAMIRTYQRARVYALFWRDPAVMREAGFQQEQALTAFGSGGLLGRGAGQLTVGRTVPEAHNDMIFALIGEQFGFVGSAAVILAYMVLFAAGIEIAASTREPFGRLLAVGICAMLAGQTLLNLMVSVRMMPVTGVTLPFVSYGGSSMLASFISVGLLLNIARNRPLVIAKDPFEFE